MSDIQEEDLVLMVTSTDEFLEGIRSLDAALATLGAQIVNESKKERVASRLIDIHRYAWLGDVRGVFIRFKGGIWVENVEMPLEYLISRYLAQIGMPTTTENIKSVKDKAKRIKQLKHSDFDNETYYINFLNGVLDTRTWEFSPHPAEFYSFSQIPHNYNPDARCATFSLYLAEWLSNDIDAIERWFEWNGYCLQPSIKFKKEALYIGPTDGGKTTCSKIQIAAIGEDNHSEVTFQNLCSENKFQRSAIIHKLFNYDDDLSKIAIAAMNEFKRMTGHKFISFEKKFQDPGLARNITKHQFCGNQLPIIEDIDLAFANRWIVFFFKNSFSKKKQNTNLAEEIIENEAEMEGIIAESIRGLKRLFARNHFTGMEKEDVLHIWNMRSDEVYRFMNECCEIEGDNQISTDDMYDAFTKWLEITGEPSDVKSKNGLTHRFRQRGISCRVRKGEGKTERYYHGIKLRKNFNEMAREGFSSISKLMKEDIEIEE